MTPADLERHVMQAGDAVYEAKVALGGDKLRLCVERLCVAIDHLGIVAMQIVLEKKEPA